MDQSDLDLIESLKDSDAELGRRWREHVELEEQLEGYQRKRVLTTEEQREVQRLKKMKLAGRDRIAEILAKHRDAAPAAAQAG